MGGVEKMVCNLCRGLVDLGHRVDLVLVKAESDHLVGLPDEVNVVKLKARHTMSSLFALTSYIRKARPDALLAAKDRAGQVAVLARVLAGGQPEKLLIRIGTTPSAALAGKSWLQRTARFLPMRMFYRFADGIVGISDGVADDLCRITGLSRGFFHTIYNPTVPANLASQAGEPCPHPWFGDGGEPVVLGVGRLTRQKDFPTLLRAFAILEQQRACRLVILGEGGDRKKLEALRDELGLNAKVDLPGFVDNPYAYMARADLFVLSSAWEGFGNVLVEALAVGTPVVATDCPNGPREILQGGQVAPLVPVGDVNALATAMNHVLEAPPDPKSLQLAVQSFTVEESSRQYADLLLK
ncbi:MAG: glycosyl transferase [Desulfuromonas sp.]|nr:MAG: glycosyl transferase [Desulfuromonas sp.]